MDKIESMEGIKKMGDNPGSNEVAPKKKDSKRIT